MEPFSNFGVVAPLAYEMPKIGGWSMGNELKQAIRAEIERVEAELDKQKAALKHCEQSEHWDIEVRMRSLRIRVDELYQNLHAAIEAYNPPA